MTESELRKAIKVAYERDRMKQALKKIEKNREYLQIGYECATEEWVRDYEFKDVLKKPLCLAMDTVKLELLQQIAEKTKELRAMSVVPDDADGKEDEK